MASISILKLEKKIQQWRDENSHVFVLKLVYGLRSIYRSAMQFLYFNAIVSKIKNTGHVNDLEHLFTLASKGWHGIIAPIQSRNEFVSLLRTVSNPQPIRLLEIGTASGGTLFMFTRVAADNAKIASVDLPNGSFGGGYPPKKISLYQAFALPNQQLKLIRADSHAPETFERVKEYFDGQPIDFIFIDGDHTYEGVRNDFEMYKRLIKRGGYIAFHDTVYAEGVKRFWSEIKEQHETKWEFISNKNPRYGIGVLRIDQNTLSN
jgi:cephalosporin hydroxylase